MKEKKKLVTKTGQAAVKFSPWSLMEHLNFLSDTVEPRKTVTNYETHTEQLLYNDALPSEALLDTFQGYVPDTQEYQEQTEQTTFSSSQSLRLPSHPNSSSYRFNSASSPTRISCAPSVSCHAESNVHRSSNVSYPRDSTSPFINSLTRASSVSHHCESNSSRYYNTSYPRDSTSPPVNSLTRASSFSHHSESNSPRNASYPRDSASPSAQQTEFRRVDNYSKQNQTPPIKKAKKRSSETHTDAMDEAILNLVEKRSSTDTMNSDDLFYLSISRDSQHLDLNTKLRLKSLVLQVLTQVMSEEQNKT